MAEALDDGSNKMRGFVWQAATMTPTPGAMKRRSVHATAGVMPAVAEQTAEPLPPAQDGSAGQPDLTNYCEVRQAALMRSLLILLPGRSAGLFLLLVIFRNIVSFFRLQTELSLRASGQASSDGYRRLRTANGG
jgi:hypothetical protein